MDEENNSLPEPTETEAPIEETPVEEVPTEEVSAEEAPIESEEKPVEETPILSSPEPEEKPEEKPKKKTGPIVIGILLFALVAVSGAIVSLKPWERKIEPTPQTSQEESAPIELPPVSELRLEGNDISEFDLAFLKVEEGNKNVVYSPLSIKYALAMLADGAEGVSKAQIENLIGSYSSRAYINSEHRSLANAMFIRNDFAENVKSTYTDTLNRKYNASVVLDPFLSPANVNSWISDKTLGIINNMLDETTVNTATDYLLINALAIDMSWINKIQCLAGSETSAEIPCRFYSVRYAHEKYGAGISDVEFMKKPFNSQEKVEVGSFGASINRYDIISELGEDQIRATVRSEYETYLHESIEENRQDIAEETEETPEWLHEARARNAVSLQESLENIDSFIDSYIEELSQNFGRISTSSDFRFNGTDEEKVFVKDLQEYDGAMLEYVAIMPKASGLRSYLNNFSVEKFNSLLDDLKNPELLEDNKEGVVTKISGYIPFYKFNYELNLVEDLQELGVTNIFSPDDADLSNMLIFDKDSSAKPFINIALHKADIDFSNDGIKAAAVTALGGRGAAGGWDYLWDIPVEEIDLTFDNPFLFLIRDKATGEVWFVGSVYEI